MPFPVYENSSENENPCVHQQGERLGEEKGAGRLFLVSEYVKKLPKRFD